jgi:hypothetical protein
VLNTQVRCMHSCIAPYSKHARSQALDTASPPLAAASAGACK